MPLFASEALTLLCLLLLGDLGDAQEEEHQHKIGLVLGSEVERKLRGDILSAVMDVLDAVFTTSSELHEGPQANLERATKGLQPENPMLSALELWIVGPAQRALQVLRAFWRSWYCLSPS